MTAPMHDEPSPRTAEAPMAFTTSELVGGVITAAVAFNIAAPVLTIAVAAIADPRYVGFAAYVVLFAWFLVVAPSTLVMCLAFTPLARVIGRAMRAEARRWPHLLVYAGLGATASVAASILAGLVIGALSGGGARTIGDGIAFLFPWGGILAPIAAGSAAVGWYRAWRRAIAADRRAVDAPTVGTPAD